MISVFFLVKVDIKMGNLFLNNKLVDSDMKMNEKVEREELL